MATNPPALASNRLPDDGSSIADAVGGPTYGTGATVGGSRQARGATCAGGGAGWMIAGGAGGFAGCGASAIAAGSTLHTTSIHTRGCAATEAAWCATEAARRTTGATTRRATCAP